MSEERTLVGVSRAAREVVCRYHGSRFLRQDRMRVVPNERSGPDVSTSRTLLAQGVVERVRSDE